MLAHRFREDAGIHDAGLAMDASLAVSQYLGLLCFRGGKMLTGTRLQGVWQSVNSAGLCPISPGSVWYYKRERVVKDDLASGTVCSNHNEISTSEVLVATDYVSAALGVAKHA